MSFSKQHVGIWNLLHDGTLVALEGSLPGDVRITVEIDYLRRQFSQDGRSIILILHHCSVLQFKPYDEPLITKFSDIVNADLEFLSTNTIDYPIRLATTRGELTIDFRGFEIYLDTGKSVTYEELDAACIRYWNKWEEDGKARRASK